MSFKHTLTVSVLSLFFSGIAYAAGAPANIKNVQAVMTNGKLMVTWDTATDPTGIASYRVYYSHQSILGNDGNYDDFEQTTGPANAYTFNALPLTSPVIFIGVLAVGKDGVESEGFEVEASVAVPAGSIASSSPAQDVAPLFPEPVKETPSSSASSAAPLTPLIFQAAETAGSTGVLLTFDKSLPISSALSPTTFQISDTGGSLLTVTAARQMDVIHFLLTTAPQRPDTTYVIRIVPFLTAQDGSVTNPNAEQRFRSAAAVQVAVATPTTEVSPTQEAPPAKGYGRNPALIIPVPMETVMRTPVTATKSNLPDSGLGLTGLILAAGAAAGRTAAKRKKNSTAGI